jgi:hypothetical protein
VTRKDVVVAEIFQNELRKTARFFPSIILIRITCIEVKKSLCHKHYAIQEYGGADIRSNAFFTSALEVNDLIHFSSAQAPAKYVLLPTE